MDQDVPQKLILSPPMYVFVPQRVMNSVFGLTRTLFGRYLMRPELEMALELRTDGHSCGGYHPHFSVIADRSNNYLVEAVNTKRVPHQPKCGELDFWRKMVLSCLPSLYKISSFHQRLQFQ